MNEPASVTKDIRPWAALYALALLRFSWQGLQYSPLLDDWIQYHNYARLMGGLRGAVSQLGLLAARPVAGVLDVALWSRFWGRLFWAVALLAALFTLSAWCFTRLFGRLFGLSSLVFPIVYLLIPVNFEATYWLSAATRVIPSLLIAALCGMQTHRAVRRGRALLLLPATLCCLLAACFYEQGFVLAAALMALIGLFWSRDKWIRLGSVVLPCTAYSMYAAMTAAAGPSALYRSRGALYLPFVSEGYFDAHLPELLSQLAAVLKGIPSLTLRAFIRGIPMAVLRPIPLFLAICLIGVVAVFCKPDRHQEEDPPLLLSCLFALALMAAAFAPFFVVAPPWVGLRALGCCLPGIALLAASMVQMIPPFAYRWMAALAAGVFMVASASELHDYRATAQWDADVVRAIGEAHERYRYDRQEAVAVLGLMPSHLTAQNYEWHEHIHGVTESRWALTGALRAHMRDLDVPVVTPLYEGRVYGEYADLTQYTSFLLFAQSEGAAAALHVYRADRAGQPSFYSPYSATGRPVADIYEMHDGTHLVLYHDEIEALLASGGIP